MDQWEVVVAVGAELDLMQPVRFGPAHLGQPPRHASIQLPPDPVLPNVPGEHVVSLQQVTRISTSTFYWVVVDADDEDEAVLLVERDIDPVVSVGLTLVLGHDVPTQVVRVKRLGSTEDPATYWGGQTQLRRLAQHRPDRAELTRVLDALRDDPRVAGCLRYLTRATRYLAITPTAGDLAIDAALLELAKALEYLVRKTPVEEDEDAAGTTDRILAGLAKKLTSSMGGRRKASAVKKAARSLQLLERRTVTDSVRAFAAQHDLETSWTATAVRLIEVRHKHLAHPGERMPRSDRTALVGDETGARWVVHEAIRALLRAGSGVEVPEAVMSRQVSAGDVTIRWNPGPVASWTTTPGPASHDA